MDWGRVLRAAPCWLLLAGCAGSPAPSAVPQTQVRLGDAPPPVAAQEAPLPNLPPMTSGGSLAEARSPRLKNLLVQDQDLGIVIRSLAQTFGVQYQIDPAVQGRVNTTLVNKTLPEALDAILPHQFSYQIRNGVLRVGPARLETRIFTLDYVALARVGTASTVIQRRFASGGLNQGGGSTSGTAGATGNLGGQSGAGGGFGGGADVITGVSIADVWEDIRVAVDALVFDSHSAQSGAQSSSNLAGFGGIGGGPAGGRPSSRIEADGRRLIVNPIAGTIVVSAIPSRLEQVETFIKTFEASIQRQVLIEAKIVEVNLDRNFEFGIDWNVIARSGGTALTGSLSPGGNRLGTNAEFTLKGSTQISTVLTALESQGDVRVLSSPRVSALNNQRAVFDVTTGEIVFNVSQQTVVGPGGVTVPTTTVTPTQINVGIVLDVLPQIGADNTVTMNIRPVVTSVARVATFTSTQGTIQAPVIDTRESDTMARLRAGETIIIGGLMQNRHEKVKSGVPVLKSIPLIGRLFTRTIEVERKAELVIFLTPTIIAGQPPAGR